MLRHKQQARGPCKALRRRSPISRSIQATTLFTTCTAMLSQAGRSRAPPSTSPCEPGRDTTGAAHSGAPLQPPAPAHRPSMAAGAAYHCTPQGAGKALPLQPGRPPGRPCCSQRPQPSRWCSSQWRRTARSRCWRCQTARRTAGPPAHSAGACAWVAAGGQGGARGWGGAGGQQVECRQPAAAAQDLCHQHGSGRWAVTPVCGRLTRATCAMQHTSSCTICRV